MVSFVESIIVKFDYIYLKFDYVYLYTLMFSQNDNDITKHQLSTD